LRALKFVLLGAVLVAALSFAVMCLWNWLIPAVFNGHAIGFWEAMGLLVLSKILFGGFRGRFGGSGHWRRGMMARWAQMTPGERRVPRAPLPSMNPLEAWRRKSSSGLRATWLGHSTVLLEIGGYRVLTDPVWGPRASPSRFAGPKRFQPVPVPLRSIPPIDLV